MRKFEVSHGKAVVVLIVLVVSMFSNVFPLTTKVVTDGDINTLSLPPTTEWNKTYGGAAAEVAHSVVQLPGQYGGYVLAGTTFSFGAGAGDFWLVKINPAGNTEWSKTYGGANSEEAAWSVVWTSDGGYALAGYTLFGNMNTWLVKTDSNGNMQWNKTYGAPNHNWAASMVQTFDGGYALLGSIMTLPGTPDFRLVKTDSNGNMQWSKTYGTLYGFDYGFSVVQTGDGGYAIAGSGFANLVKTDANGTLLWSQSYGGAADSLVVTSDGGYALAGSFGGDFWLVKTDSNGNMQWNKTYGGAGDEKAHSVVRTFDGGYALAGYTYSYGAGSSDFWLVKTDSNGNIEWSRPYGGTGSEEAWSVIQTSDGGYALAGYTYSYGAGSSDFWLVKLGLLAVLRHFPAPTQGNEGGVGIAFDGSTIYYTLRNERGKIYKTEPNGADLGFITTSLPNVEWGALTWDGMQLWASAFDNSGRVFTIDPKTGVATLRFTFTGWRQFPDTPYGGSEGYIDGLEYDVGSNTLWLSVWAGYTVYHVTNTGAVISYFAVDPRSNTGIVTDGSYLWLVLYDPPDPDTTYPNAVIQKTTSSGLALSSFSAGGILQEDLAGVDYITFEPKHAIWAISRLIGPSYGAYITAFEIYQEPDGWFWKANCTDYAPSGVPDFDQKQYDWWGYNDSGVWKWTWSGPTAVANSFWWLDSRFETGNVIPPNISDSFPLVQSPDPWWMDDHDPQNAPFLIGGLAYFMDTEGQRTNLPHHGTNVTDMEAGIAHWLIHRGINPAGDVNGDGMVDTQDLNIVLAAYGSGVNDPNWNLAADVTIDNIVNDMDVWWVQHTYGQMGKFYEKTVKMPDFNYIEKEVKKSEDVILLIGFWQQNATGWWRLGGHYVTVAGIQSLNRTIAMSDPMRNRAEDGGWGRIIPPPPHGHPPTPPDTIHNNATFVSHDFSTATQSPSPGGKWRIGCYTDDKSFIENNVGQNIPKEFVPVSTDYLNMSAAVIAEIEYAIIVSPTSWFWKANYTDYAPSAVPDFDQRQNNWTSPSTGNWTWSGPTAVANSLWWFDSQFEPGNITPPEISDGFSLVESYNKTWDDHDPQNVPPLIEDLAWYMDTDGIRTGIPHNGTNVMDMQFGILWYMKTKGLMPQGDVNGDGIVDITDYQLVQNATGWSGPGNATKWEDLNHDGNVNTFDLAIVNATWGRQGKFYEKTVKMPDFYYIEKQVEKSEDVILLLGFWQQNATGWWRLGGHYVTVAGVDSQNLRIAFSDPIRDNAEAGGPGQVIPVPPYIWIPPDHGHPATPPDTIHNNATFVSHDIYNATPSLSIGGIWGPENYAYDSSLIQQFYNQSIPVEFLNYTSQYNASSLIHTEVEYAVIVSCRGPIVAAGSENGFVYAFDSAGNLMWSYDTSPVGYVPVVSVAMSTHGEYIAAGTQDKELLLFDKAGTLLWRRHVEVSVSYDGRFDGTESKTVDISGDGQYIVAAALPGFPWPPPPGAGGLLLFDKTGTLIWQYEYDKRADLAQISTDGNYIVAIMDENGDGKNEVLFFSAFKNSLSGWQPADGTPVLVDYSYSSSGGTAFWAAIDALGKYVVASGDRDGDGKMEVVLYMFGGPPTWIDEPMRNGYIVVDIAWDGRSVVAANDDPTDTMGAELLYYNDMKNSISGWQPADGTPQWTFAPSPNLPTNDFYSVAISPDGERISTGGVPNNIYLLAKDGTLLDTIPDGTVQSVDLSYRGEWVAAGDREGYVYEYQRDTVKSGWSYSIVGPNATIRSVAIEKIYPCLEPIPSRDVSIPVVEPWEPSVEKGSSVNVNVTVQNQGHFTETFDVTLYANATVIASRTLTLESGASTTITFTWNTTGFTEGDYSLRATASLVPWEKDMADNTLTNGIVRVTYMGDFDGDFDVDYDDIIYFVDAYIKYWSGQGRDPVCDFDKDGDIDYDDILTFVSAYIDYWTP